MQHRKNSRNREQQLLKKLNSVKSAMELHNILKVAKEQNRKLTSQIQQVKERIENVKYRQTMSQNLQIQSQIERQISHLKKQLKTKYTKMKHLKELINHEKGDKKIQLVNNKASKFNEIANMEKEIKKITKEIEDYKASNEKLEMTMEDNKREDNLNGTKIDELQAQNKELRFKIAEMRKNDYEHEIESKKVQNKLITTRRRARDQQARKSMFDLKNLGTMDKFDIVGDQFSRLKREVDNLKKEVKQVEENEKAQTIERKSKMSRLAQQNKQRMKKLQELDMQKLKFQRQNNLWKNKQGKINLALQKQNNKIKSKIEKQVQTFQFKNVKPLRRQFVGILNKYRFDDRQMLQENKATKIVGLTVYQKQSQITAIKAFYSNNSTTILQIPQNFLDRCKKTTVHCQKDDYIKQIKIKYAHIGNKINKIDILTNNGKKHEFGNKQQWVEIEYSNSIYDFDIQTSEYPVSIFGSYSCNKGLWVLEGFGVEINEN